MIFPIYHLLFGEDKSDREPSLELTEDQITISYKTYKIDLADDRQAIFDGKLTPGILTRRLIFCLQSITHDQ